MRHEPIELSLANAALRERRSALAARLSRAATQPSDASTAAVIDEAFAGFEQTKMAAPTRKVSVGTGRPLKQELVANLAGQLDALDRQRDQLTQLLRSIDTTAIAE